MIKDKMYKTEIEKTKTQLKQSIQMIDSFEKEIIIL